MIGQQTNTHSPVSIATVHDEFCLRLLSYKSRRPHSVITAALWSHSLVPTAVCHRCLSFLWPQQGVREGGARRRLSHSRLAEKARGIN